MVMNENKEYSVNMGISSTNVITAGGIIKHDATEYIAQKGLFSDDYMNSERIIYTPSNFAKDNLTYLQEVGELSALKTHSTGRENLSSYLFFIVTKGHGSVKYGGVTYNMSPGDCVFISCMNKYEHVSSPDLWTLKWVHFNGITMDAIYEKYKERGGRVVFSSPNPAEVIKLIDEIHDVADSDSYLRDMEIHEKLAMLLLHIMKESWHEKQVDMTSEKRKDLRLIREYIEQNYDKDIKLDDLAKEYSISKYYMSHIFREQYGTSITNYLIQVRITKAKHYLRFTQLSTSDVAAKVGYEDVNYFIRMFKKVENITPGEYRKRW